MKQNNYFCPLLKNVKHFLSKVHTKPEGLQEFKLIKQIETFHFKPLIHIDGSWMVRLTSLEDYNSSFNITTTNEKFELYTDNLTNFPLKN